MCYFGNHHMYILAKKKKKGARKTLVHYIGKFETKKVGLNHLSRIKQLEDTWHYMEEVLVS